MLLATPWYRSPLERQSERAIQWLWPAVVMELRQQKVLPGLRKERVAACQTALNLSWDCGVWTTGTMESTSVWPATRSAQTGPGCFYWMLPVGYLYFYVSIIYLCITSLFAWISTYCSFLTTGCAVYLWIGQNDHLVCFFLFFGNVTRYFNFSLSLIRHMFPMLLSWCLCEFFPVAGSCVITLILAGHYVTLSHIVCQPPIDQSSNQVYKFRANREATWCSAMKGKFISCFHLLSQTSLLPLVILRVRG